MNNKRWILLLVGIGCLLMSLVDMTKMHYVPKAMIKISTFVSIPFLYTKISKDNHLWETLRFHFSSVRLAVWLGLILYGLILITYFLIGPWFDFSNVARVLDATVGVNPGNFIYIAVYISLINSFIEELFFRGFAFLTLKKYTSRRFAIYFSSIAFALYHVTLMAGLFEFTLYLLFLFALVIAGYILNRLDEKSSTSFPSWVFHAFANFAINTIGFILLGMI